MYEYVDIDCKKNIIPACVRVCLRACVRMSTSSQRVKEKDNTTPEKDMMQANGLHEGEIMDKELENGDKGTYDINMKNENVPMHSELHERNVSENYKLTTLFAD